MTLDQRRKWIAARDPEKVRASDRARYERDKKKRRAAAKKYISTERGKLSKLAGCARWSKANRHKTRAQCTARRAKYAGKLKQGGCEVCGTNERVHGHHDDYTKPLNVRWLCPVHHSEHHKKQRAILRAMKEE
jgi:predicted aminopeptidase